MKARRMLPILLIAVLVTSSVIACLHLMMPEVDVVPSDLVIRQVPEPSTVTLFGLGIGVIVLRGRRIGRHENQF